MNREGWLCLGLIVLVVGFYHCSGQPIREPTHSEIRGSYDNSYATTCVSISTTGTRTPIPCGEYSHIQALNEYAKQRTDAKIAYYAHMDSTYQLGLRAQRAAKIESDSLQAEAIARAVVRQLKKENP